MKKAFTLIELLVVIAIIAILAAMLMPALERARQEAQKSNCRSNLHQVGLAMEMLRNDNAGIYPGWVWGNKTTAFVGNAVLEAHNGEYLGGAPGTVPGEAWVDNKGDPWWQMCKPGYLDDVTMLKCPGFNPYRRTSATGNYWWYDVPVLVEPGTNVGVGDQSGSVPNSGKFVANVHYGYDLGRVDLTSNAGRVIVADGTWFQGMENQEGFKRAAHKGGANVLYVDNAVAWAPANSPETVIYDNKGYFRFGVVPNPRLDENGHYTDDPNLKAQAAIDVDDIYSIGCDINRTVRITPTAGGAAPAGWNAGWWEADASLYQNGVSGDQNSRISPWRPMCYHRGGTAMGEANNRYIYYYEQRGIFANEIRWDKEDARICFFPPFRVGHPGLFVQWYGSVTP